MFYVGKFVLWPQPHNSNDLPDFSIQSYGAEKENAPLLAQQQ